MSTKSADRTKQKLILEPGQEAICDLDWLRQTLSRMNEREVISTEVLQNAWRIGTFWADTCEEGAGVYLTGADTAYSLGMAVYALERPKTDTDRQPRRLNVSLSQDSMARLQESARRLGVNDESEFTAWALGAYRTLLEREQNLENNGTVLICRADGTRHRAQLLTNTPTPGPAGP